LRLPSFIYGTAWKESQTARLTYLAIKSGFRAIDTANQRKHYFEAAVGEALTIAIAEGMVTRAGLFIQTKFTPRDGQDHRLPYDPDSSLTEQVAQSMENSLDHLQTGYVDSYLLHGPSSGSEWTADDTECWTAMRRERDAGRTRLIGVSNVGIWHLERMLEVEPELPGFVQNRCFARTGWDRKVRTFCREHSIAYQGTHVEESLAQRFGAHGIEAAEGFVENDEAGLPKHRGDELDFLRHALAEGFDPSVGPFGEVEALEPCFGFG